MSAHGRQSKFSPQRPQLKAYTVSRKLYTPSRGVGAPKRGEHGAASKELDSKPVSGCTQAQKNTTAENFIQSKAVAGSLAAFSAQQKLVKSGPAANNKSRQSQISVANNTGNVISDFKPYSLPTRMSKSKRLQELDKQVRAEAERVSQKKQLVYARMQQNDFLDDNMANEKLRTFNHGSVTNRAGVKHEPAIEKRKGLFISRFFKQSKQYYLTVGAAVFVLLLGVGVSLHTLLVNREAKEQVAVLSESTSSQRTDDQLEPGAIPDESDQDDGVIRSHRVAPDMPRYLRIPSIGVDNRIVQIGVNDNNQLGAPASIYDVGWYTGSVKPGKPGALLMDGHVSGPTRPGVFKNLVRLDVGDMIEVERGDGRIFEYKVVKKQSFPYENTDMQSALVSVENGKNGLNLITCDGRFNASTNNYENRLIVYAVEV